MLTLIDIQKAIEKNIKDALVNTEYSTIKPTAEDIIESIVRPGIKVRFEGSKNGLFNALCREKTLTVRIYFFAKDRYKYSIDNLKMQDILENAFIKEIVINNNYFYIENVESEVVDSVLICSFDLYMIEELPNTDTSEPIESLNLILET